MVCADSLEVAHPALLISLLLVAHASVRPYQQVESVSRAPVDVLRVIRVVAKHVAEAKAFSQDSRQFTLYVASDTCCVQALRFVLLLKSS